MFTCTYRHYFLIYLISYSNKNKLGISEDVLLQSSTIIGFKSFQHCIASISQSHYCFQTEGKKKKKEKSKHDDDML